MTVDGGGGSGLGLGSAGTFVDGRTGSLFSGGRKVLSLLFFVGLVDFAVVFAFFRCLLEDDPIMTV